MFGRKYPAKAAIEALSRRVIEQHAPTLAERRRQLLCPDIYGVCDALHWDREKARFFERVILPACRADPAWHQLPILDRWWSDFELVLVPAWIEAAADAVDRPRDREDANGSLVHGPDGPSSARG